MHPLTLCARRRHYKVSWNDGVQSLAGETVLNQISKSFSISIQNSRMIVFLKSLTWGYSPIGQPTLCTVPNTATDPGNQCNCVGFLSLSLYLHLTYTRTATPMLPWQANCTPLSQHAVQWIAKRSPPTPSSYVAPGKREGGKVQERRNRGPRLCGCFSDQSAVTGEQSLTGC